MKQAAYSLTIAWAFIVGATDLLGQELQPRLKFKAHTGSTRTALVADDKLLITLGGEHLENDGRLVGDKTVKVWDFATGKQRDFPELVGQSIALSPDGNTLAIGWSKDGPNPFSAVGVAELWNLATSKPLAKLDPNRGPMRALAFSPDGKLLAVATQTFPKVGDVRIWDGSAGQVHSTLEAGGVDCLAFSPTGRRWRRDAVAASTAARKIHPTTFACRMWEPPAASTSFDTSFA